jgi:hypothetical protein
MMKRMILLAVLALVSTTCVLAQTRELVEVGSTTKVYQNASTGSGVVTGDFERLTTAVFKDFVMPPPFTQPVLERQNGWLKIPMGWVQENQTRKAGNEPFTAELMGKVFLGNFGKYEETGDTVYFGVQVIDIDESKGEAFVTVHLPDSKLLCLAKRSASLIETSQGIMVKDFEYEEDRKGLAFELYNERDGVKLYKLLYGERWNTRKMEDIMGDIVTVNTFDINKMTKEDWTTLRSAIMKDGKPCQIYVTAGMVSGLQPIDL